MFVRCIQITIADIGIHRIVYSRLLPKLTPSTNSDIRSIATGAYAADIMDANETNFVSARITAKMQISYINTFGLISRNADTPKRTPFPPLKP